MAEQIKIPAVGESISEATISQWLKKDGEQVKRDEILLTLETDKASVEVVAEHSGKLSVKSQEGETVEIGAVVGEIDTSSAGSEKSESKSASSSNGSGNHAPSKDEENDSDQKDPGPAVRKLMEENSLDASQISGTGKDGRIIKGDVLSALSSKSESPSTKDEPKKQDTKKDSPTPLPQAKKSSGEGGTTREPMSKLRQTIAKRLVEAQHTAAILTTFNEIDMTEVMALRSKYKESFKKHHGVNLGFMGFFVKAAIEALKSFPRVNGYIDGTDVVFNHSHNVGIAVGTEKGLIVPVIKNAGDLSLAEIEMSIKHYAEKARDGKISIDDLSGGTFTISNGGVYGSLMSTPILNPPQSGILGLHKIEERPMAIDGKVEVRPMMYVALSYDHRIIDGAESVQFLVKIKQMIEDPARLLLEI